MIEGNSIWVWGKAWLVCSSKAISCRIPRSMMMWKASADGSHFENIFCRWGSVNNSAMFQSAEVENNEVPVIFLRCWRLNTLKAGWWSDQVVDWMSAWMVDWWNGWMTTQWVNGWVNELGNAWMEEWLNDCLSGPLWPKNISEHFQSELTARCKVIHSLLFIVYPLVNSHITMENHHVQWENSL